MKVPKVDFLKEILYYESVLDVVLGPPKEPYLSHTIPVVSSLILIGQTWPLTIVGKE